MSDKYQPPINDPRDVRSASEGDYSGIWERQYGTHPGPQSNQQSRTQSLGYHPTALPGLERSTNYNGNRSREHIYESPKFDTCSASGCPGDFPVPVYFELETDRPGHPPKYTAKYQQWLPNEIGCIYKTHVDTNRSSDNYVTWRVVIANRLADLIWWYIVIDSFRIPWKTSIHFVPTATRRII